jgi:hypothetical protein
MTRTTIVIAATLAFAATLPAIPAWAVGAIRTFVSTAGMDTNPCSITAPCRHFQAAVNVTDIGGEVDALDPGAYGSFTISQAITIEGQGWSYVAPPNSGNAITINTVSGNVIIRGLSLNGVGTTNTNGIQFNSGDSLTVTNSVLQNFTGSGANGNGIIAGPTGTSSLLISKTSVLNNANAGIYLTPKGRLTASIDQVTADHNNYGIYIDSSGSNSYLTYAITDSHVDANNNTGIVLYSTNTSGFNFGTIRDTNVSLNDILSSNITGGGITVSGGDTSLFLTRSNISSNGQNQLALFSGATLFTDGQNSGDSPYTSGGTVISRPLY